MDDQKLSECRAEAVVERLVEDGGLDEERLESTGHGDTEPAVEEKNGSEGTPENRRVVVSAGKE